MLAFLSLKVDSCAEGQIMDREINNANTYKDVLLKLMPGEIVAAYMVIDGLLPADQSFAKWLALGASVILTILTPLYLRKLYNMKSWSQTLFTTGTFVVWLYWIGGPFKLWGLHSPPLGSILLVLWTLLVPFLNLPSKFSIGQVVQITSKRPSDVQKADFLCVWVPRMDKFLGKTAHITDVNRRKQTLKLDLDNGEHVWSFDWFEPTIKTGGNHDAES